MSYSYRFSTLCVISTIFVIFGVSYTHAKTPSTSSLNLPKLQDHVMLDLGISDRMLSEALDHVRFTEEEYRQVKLGVFKLWKSDLGAEEIVSLDPKFADGIDAYEWIDFLKLFGRGEDAEWQKLVSHLESWKKNQEPVSQVSKDEISEVESRQEIEEVVAYGYSFSRFPEHPKDFSVQDIKGMRLIRERANRLYRQGEYARSFPMLLQLAKRGFRDAQSRTAYILLHGAGDIRKSNLRALGWLGAASASPTEPGFRVLFNKYMREMPEAVRPMVDEVVRGYREAFAHSEHLQCSTEHPYALHHGSSIVKRTFCRYRIEAIADACGPNCWVHEVNNSKPIQRMKLPREEIWKEWHDQDLLVRQLPQ